MQATPNGRMVLAHHMEGMRRSLPVVLTLVALLIAATILAWHEWASVPAGDPAGGTGMSANGTAALIIGAIGSLILGGGLMALVFLSSRSGADDQADPGRSSDTKQTED